MRFPLATGIVGLGLVLVVLATARATPPPEMLPTDPAPSARPPTTQPNDPLHEPTLFPHEDTLCGPFALYLACRSYGITSHSAMDLARMAEFNGRSTSIDGLRQACDRIGLHALAAQVNAPALEKLVRGGQARAVVLLRGGHFCYVDQADGGRFRI